MIYASSSNPIHGVVALRGMRLRKSIVIVLHAFRRLLKKHPNPGLFVVFRLWGFADFDGKGLRSIAVGLNLENTAHSSDLKASGLLQLISANSSSIST
ncbi:hypothetical protein L1049_000798 [Liquidambar formosana]|uniref:Uncharacterized protein n=1 Tax=Liquidambar formosana TaxID=63359 RepID=A0AAP0NC42_LIQFO